MRLGQSFPRIASTVAFEQQVVHLPPILKTASEVRGRVVACKIRNV